MKRQLVLATALAFVAGNAMAATQDSESANATITIVQSLNLTKTKDLVFPTASQGDAAYTVAPADAEAATFAVEGQADANITTAIVEPSIEMIKDLGDTPNQRISVYGFTNNAPAALSGTGTATFGVGATHADILADQQPGIYNGIFNVTVSYQ